jgi:hypothetical protein
VLTTDQKGAIAEAAIALAAIRLGVEVYRPVAEGGRFDMIFVIDDRLLRVQCKWAPLHGDTVVVRTYSNRRAREGLRRRVYTAEEIDAFAAYCPDLDRCYFLPIESFAGRTQVYLRLSPARNNQRSLVNWAKDFEFDAKLGRQIGAVAQLGERRAGSAKATGSSPVGSMKRGARDIPRPSLFR